MASGWGGEVLRTTVQSLGRGGALPAPRPVGERLLTLAREAGRDGALAELAAREPGRLQETELTDGLDAFAVAARALVRARLRLVCEAAARGLHTSAGFTLHDWVVCRCPDLDPAAARDLARLAQASCDPVHAPLVDAVTGGAMSLHRAARAHRALARIRRALSPVEYGDAVQLLTEAASNPAFDDHDLHRIIGRLLACVLPEKDHEERAQARHRARDVHESSLADGSLRRLILTFGDDADYHTVRAILASPLAAPATAEEEDATGEPDRRTPGNRRYDALMTVIRRGVAGTRGQPTTPKATVHVTLDFATLRRDLLGDDDGTPGCGATLDGHPVTASTIRRLACDADLVPLVLGGPSEILDQGRRRRLVTPAQRTRLAARDHACTIPGCTVPATWCDAHHIVPWAQGGRSDLGNYALLCPRHHTWVHTHRHTATATAHGVTWHLR